MSKKRWFRFYIERWRDGCAGLTPNEITAYLYVVCELYDNGGGILSPNLNLIAHRCGMRPTSFRKAFDTLLDRGKLTLEGEYLTSKAVSEEIKSREKLDEKSGESRQKGTEKAKENNGIRKKVPPNKEYRIQNKKTLEVSALPPNEGALEGMSPALANFYKRRAVAGRA